MSATKVDLAKAILLWNGILSLSSIPLLASEYWSNVIFLLLIIPNVLGMMPRGGKVWGRLSLDMPFLLISTIISLAFTLLITETNENIKEDFVRFGKNTRSTVTVIGLRALGLTIGFIISYLLFGGDKMYSHFNSN
jgi:hypothetical protein|tara:strand:- start:2815 stop:3222 length:408 start_codon:yes stop_codon:yes gene_type:complete